jgi:D-aminoacyl-tRNA deacylase
VGNRFESLSEDKEILRLVIQRVREGAVTVEDRCVGRIEQGLVVLAGVGQGDAEATINRMVDKLVNLRIFGDENSKMNRSVLDIGGSILIISQFTLYADCRRGRRHAALPSEAKRLYDYFVERCRATGIQVACGIFAADMLVQISNDGPVTIILDSADWDNREHPK